MATEWWAALPDVPYKGITFTMPDVLWPLFHDNPHLTEALSALAAKIIQTRVSIRSSLRVGVMAILHTFNGKLEFNSHVHTMVTAGGLYGLSDSWVRTVYYERDGLLDCWRRAVIKLLRTALRAGQLVSGLTVDELETLLSEQGDTLVERQYQVLQVQRSFPEVCRSLHQETTHCTEARLFCGTANRQTLVQRQEGTS